MSIDITIKGQKKGDRALVTERGELIVAPLAYSTFYPVIAAVAAQGITVVAPKSGKQFVITSISLYGDKNVGVNDASVQLYEADEDNGNTVSRSIYSTEVPKNARVTEPNLRILLKEGKWLIAVTDDNNIFVNVSGYFVGAINE